MASTSATSIHVSPRLMRSHHAQRTSSSSEVVLLRSRFSATAELTTTLRLRDPQGKGYLKMLTARAATSRIVSAETADSESISSFVRRVSGIASVGLNATELVKDT
jgi:hypothetical protein